MRTIIAGGRDYAFTGEDRYMLDQMRVVLPITEVVCGGARGVDTEGRKWAESRSIPVVTFLPDWDAEGRNAGPMRNRRMALYADVLIAFPGGRGTADMVCQARAHGLKIIDLRELEKPRQPG